MEIKTKLNTIFVLVGPTKAGKTTFAKELHRALLEVNQDSTLTNTCTVLSSDNYRYMLTGDDTLDQHSPAMLEVSEQAFKMLMTDLNAFTTYPVNHDFLIVDTTGLNEHFRNELLAVADRNHYNIELIVFEYKKGEAIRDVPEEYRSQVLSQLNRMKRDVMPNLKAKAYAQRTKIKERDANHWADLKVVIEDHAVMSPACLYLRKEDGVAIIGDTHEHVFALNELIEKLDAIDPTLQKVHVGDWLDKGGNTKAMLYYMVKRALAGDILVAGNHEAYVVRRLRGEIEPQPEIEAKYLTSIKTFLEDPPLQDLLFELYDNHTVPFLKITGENCRTMYVTHAPCEEKYLGKLSFEAKRAQRNMFVKDKEQDIRHAYEFIFEEANGIKPLHVFGHIAHKATKLDYKNKIFLDTGAVYGNKLTSLVYKNNNYQFVSVATTRLDTTDKELSETSTTPMKSTKPFNIRDYDLTPEELRFVNGFMKKGIQYISGTMAPAPSTDTELESLEAGLEYFRKRDIEQVVLQPKYMGSRCQLYLFKNEPEKGFAVSRNGFLINPERVEGLSELIARETAKFNTWEVGDSVILDGELLPWSALGVGLIENQFEAYQDLVLYELDSLNCPEMAELDFERKPDFETRFSDVTAFTETLALYNHRVGTEPGQAPLDFKAFTALKIDGENCTRDDQAYAFPNVNDDPQLVVRLNDAEDLVKAKAFFDTLTVEKGMEGVVIKPRIPKDGVVPYMKVRNEDYLRLVYGYDYQRRYAAFCRQKNISNKTRVSIKEYELGSEMLTASGDYLKELVVKMVGQLSQEKTLDPRL